MFNWLKNIFQNRTFGVARSGKWASFRKEFLRKNPLCAVCNKKGTLLSPNEAHHIKLFNKFPELELVESNVIVLCREHHFWFGHLGDFKSFNSKIREDAEIWRNKILNRP